MRICLNPTCQLQLMEDAVCSCGWDNSLPSVGVVELMEESAILSAEARVVGGAAGAVLRMEAAELAEDAVEESQEVFWG